MSGSKLIPRDPSREEETPFGKSWIEPGLGWNVAQLPVVSSNRGPFSFSSDSKHELLNSPRLQNGVKTLSFELKKDKNCVRKYINDVQQFMRSWVRIPPGARLIFLFSFYTFTRKQSGVLKKVPQGGASQSVTNK